MSGKYIRKKNSFRQIKIGRCRMSEHIKYPFSSDGAGQLLKLPKREPK